MIVPAKRGGRTAQINGASSTQPARAWRGAPGNRPHVPPGAASGASSDADISYPPSVASGPSGTPQGVVPVSQVNNPNVGTPPVTRRGGVPPGAARGGSGPPKNFPSSAIKNSGFTLQTVSLWVTITSGLVVIGYLVFKK